MIFITFSIIYLRGLLFPLFCRIFPPAMFITILLCFTVWPKTFVFLFKSNGIFLKKTHVAILIRLLSILHLLVVLLVTRTLNFGNRNKPIIRRIPELFPINDALLYSLL